MSVTMTEMVRDVQNYTGYPRFKFLREDEIVEIIKNLCIKDFTHYFPYKTIFPIYPGEDAVDENKFPGLFKIVPDDAPIEKVYDTGMVYTGNDIAVGGYPRDLGRSVYGGSMGLGSLLYNQMNINIMSMTQPQQLTAEFLQPNFVQLYPKRRYFGSQRLICLELLLYHSDDLRTIPNSYEGLFRELCILHVKNTIFNRYRDWEDETVAGHQIRTKVSNYSDAEDKIETWKEKAHDESFKNPDRTDYFYII